jgi:hypothetical protein
MAALDVVRTHAHLALGTVRLVNGVAALLAPAASSRRLGTDPEAHPTILYPMRLFGVRTVLLGGELLLGSPETRARSLRTGIGIHASDTVAAILGGVRRGLPPRTAVLLTVVSATNTALAVAGTLGPPQRGWRRLVGR